MTLAPDIASPRIVVLIGPPAAGKSTWRETYLANAQRVPVIISSDDLIEEFGAANNMSYSDVFKLLQSPDTGASEAPQISFGQIEGRLRAALHEAVANQQDIIIDRTNMKRKSRKGFLRHVTADYTKVAVVFEVEWLELVRRLGHRERTTGKHVPASVAHDMLTSYEPPTTEEFDYIVKAD